MKNSKLFKAVICVFVLFVALNLGFTNPLSAQITIKEGFWQADTHIVGDFTQDGYYFKGNKFEYWLNQSDLLNSLVAFGGDYKITSDSVILFTIKYKILQDRGEIIITDYKKRHNYWQAYSEGEPYIYELSKPIIIDTFRFNPEEDNAFKVNISDTAFVFWNDTFYFVDLEEIGYESMNDLIYNRIKNRETKIEEKDLLIDINEISASFPGGQEKLVEYLAKEIKIPQTCEEFYGKIIVQFDVSPMGEISNIRILQGGTPNYNKAIIDAIKQMPRWNPAIANGLPIKSTYTLPINFSNKE